MSILNSHLSRYYLNSIRRHRIEYYFYPDDFKKLPIKKISLDLQKPFIENVDKLLEYNIKLNEAIKSFKKYLDINFNVGKPLKRIEKYYNLSEKELFAELKKKRVKLSSINIKEISEEFEKSITIINPLLQQIKETDNKIDQMVYDLYGLTLEEIKIIEDSLN